MKNKAKQYTEIYQQHHQTSKDVYCVKLKIKEWTFFRKKKQKTHEKHKKKSGIELT